ncbi:MAG TPA: hypothetical protein VHA05_03540 [Candidatus Saccharimonadales bacterium]|nr:hypothetical protein [Candidatus Saccharimonadales bacterium]
MSDESGGMPLYILMPDAPDIRERLEHVSDDSAFHDGVIPRIMELAGISFEPAELVESVETKLSEYAEERMLGIKVLAFTDMEGILASLVDDEDQRNELLDNWRLIVSEKIDHDSVREAELWKARRGYSQPKFPRKRKKEITKRNQRRG